MSAQLTLTIPVWLDLIFVWPILACRLLRFGFTFRRIYLGEGCWTIVDNDVYYRLGNLKWVISGNDGGYYAIRFVKTRSGKTKSVRLHREIINPPKGLFIDHKNNNTLDNRRANLRLATQSQNCCNRRKRRNTSSRFLGVSLDKCTGKWRAYINIKGKRIYLGWFDSEIDAASAYDRAAVKYHGEFAHLNFPQNVSTGTWVTL
jgi:hypothetical protein